MKAIGLSFAFAIRAVAVNKSAGYGKVKGPRRPDVAAGALGAPRATRRGKGRQGLKILQPPDIISAAAVHCAMLPAEPRFSETFLQDFISCATGPMWMASARSRSFRSCSSTRV
ncbi:hypothetical protein RSP03_24940 [Cereibacter sphaeroides]|nr:hypothetical protein RSP03_24940 [Cereibacter sphaeroides]